MTSKKKKGQENKSKETSKLQTEKRKMTQQETHHGKERENYEKVKGRRWTVGSK